MYRIDLAHLCWSIENLVEGEVVNHIEVDPQTAEYSLIALKRMLESQISSSALWRERYVF